MGEWNKVKIGDFLKERNGRIKPVVANEMGLKRLEKIDFSGNMYIVENKPTKTDMITVKNGDLVISGINVEKGALAVYEGEDNILATIHYSSYEYDKNKIDIEYLKWFLKSNAFKNVLKQQVKGGIKTEIKPKQFLPLQIYLPDIEEQRNIANKINNLANEIEELVQNDKNNEILLNQLRQSILQDAIQGKLVSQDPSDEPASVLLQKIKAEKDRLVKEGKLKNEKPLPPIKGEEKPYKLPLGWEWEKLGNLLNPSKDITYGIVKMGIEPQKGIFALRCSDVKFRYIDTFNTRKVTEEISNQYIRTILQGGELLMNIRGTLGGCAIVPSELKGFNIAREIALIPINDFICNKFILNVLTSPYIQQTTFNNLRGIAYKGLNLNILRNFLIPIPPLAEQNRIVEKVDKLMQYCNELEHQIIKSKTHSEQLIQAVLQEAFKPDEITENENTNVVCINTAIEKRAICSGGIVLQLYKLKKFGVVKHEKILYLCEKHLGLPLGGRYIKMPAGPHDYESRYKVEEIFEEKQWFSVLKETSGNAGKTVYKPATNVNEVKTLFDTCFKEESSKIMEIITLLKEKDTNYCEAIATLYAVWNDFLIDKKAFNDEDIIKEFRNNWDESKKRFNPADLRDYLCWMRSKKLIPCGKGDKTITQKQLNLL